MTLKKLTGHKKVIPLWDGIKNPFTCCSERGWRAAKRNNRISTGEQGEESGITPARVISRAFESSRGCAEGNERGQVKQRRD